MDFALRGKVAVVTGGSEGIGFAIAEGLAAEGVNVVLCARDEEKVQTAANTITEKYSVRAIGVRTDVSKAEDIKHLATTVEREHGGSDILINNAGTGSEETIMDASDERWQYYWDLHVMAAVRLSRELAPGMIERKSGIILHNASICATQPLGYEPIYNTTKAALVMFSKCLSNELAPHNIRVNAVNPGLVMTADWEKTARILTEGTGTTWDEYLSNYAKENTPMGRFATPAEIADLFVFLCSSRSTYITGSTFYIDGGWLKVTT